MTTATINQTAQVAEPHQMAAFVKKDLLAGRATFTLVSKKTGTRFTYKVNRKERDDESVVHFVSVKTGPAQDTYLGMIDSKGFRSTRASQISPTAPSHIAFAYLWKWLEAGADLQPYVEIWHMGTCLQCGRDLTDPESIESGYGPVCRRRHQ